MAQGGILAALAVIIMSLGTLIPVATYAAPMLCCMMVQLVLRLCGRRTAWAWYGAVTLLSLLMAPDKEAAAVFLALGYYPIVKPWLDRRKWKWLWKALLFNAAILAMYWLLMHLFGMTQIMEEFAGTGAVMTALLLILGNMTFFLLDRLLSTRMKRRR